MADYDDFPMNERAMKANIDGPIDVPEEEDVCHCGLEMSKHTPYGSCTSPVAMPRPQSWKAIDDNSRIASGMEPKGTDDTPPDISDHKWLDPECHDGCQSLRFKEASQQVAELTEELKEANTLLGDAGFYIRRMAKIIEGYNHPSRIHLRAMEWMRTKWKAVNLFTRWDREGRDVTNLPGLWSDDDVQVSATNFAHPTITSGQHTNGPATIWLKRCVDGAEWVNTGLKQMHKVRNAWVKANEDGAPNPLREFEVPS